jgi:hypothetical protein
MKNTINLGSKSIKKISTEAQAKIKGGNNDAIGQRPRDGRGGGSSD